MLGAFLILAASSLGVPLVLAFAIVVPLMFAVGYALQAVLLNRALGRNILPPLLITFGLSIIVQNGLLETFSADTRFLNVGPLQSASLPLGGGIAIGVMPLICLIAAVLVIVLLNALFYRTALGRAFRATSDDVEIAQLMGINNRTIYALTMGIALAVCAAAGFFLGARANFDPEHRPGAAALCLRGGDHRRAWQSVGHARRRHRRRPRADHRRAHRSGMADTVRACGVSGRAGDAAARAVSARRGLIRMRSSLIPRDPVHGRTSGPRFSVTTATRASTVTLLLAVPGIVLLLALPAFARRALLQELFYVFTMLALAQLWNLLAGSAGLISVGQQAFVGAGAYALFAFTLIAGLDAVPAIVLAGIVAGLVAIPTALIVFRLRGAYFAIGTWVVGRGLPADPRPGQAAWRRHRHLAAARRREFDVRPRFRPRTVRMCAAPRRATSSATGSRWCSPSARSCWFTGFCARATASRCPPLAMPNGRRRASASTCTAPSF